MLPTGTAAAPERTTTSCCRLASSRGGHVLRRQLGPSLCASIGARGLVGLLSARAGTRAGLHIVREERQMPGTSRTSLEHLARAHDMVLQTRKHDGRRIATPVNPLVEDDAV